jgi:hypothetical protein
MNSTSQGASAFPCQVSDEIRKKSMSKKLAKMVQDSSHWTGSQSVTALWLQEASDYAREFQALKLVRGVGTRAQRVPLSLAIAAQKARVDWQRFCSATGLSPATARAALRRFGIDLSETQAISFSVPTVVADSADGEVEAADELRPVQLLTVESKARTQQPKTIIIEGDIAAAISCYIEQEGRVPTRREVEALSGLSYCTVVRNWPRDIGDTRVSGCQGSRFEEAPMVDPRPQTETGERTEALANDGEFHTVEGTRSRVRSGWRNDSWLHQPSSPSASLSSRQVA